MSRAKKGDFQEHPLPPPSTTWEVFILNPQTFQLYHLSSSEPKCPIITLHSLQTQLLEQMTFITFITFRPSTPNRDIPHLSARMLSNMFITIESSTESVKTLFSKVLYKPLTDLAKFYICLGLKRLKQTLHDSKQRLYGLVSQTGQKKLAQWHCSNMHFILRLGFKHCLWNQG